MERSTIAAAVAIGLAPGSGRVALAQKTIDNVTTLDTGKDGMISRSGAMRMLGTKFDAMLKRKGVRTLTAWDVQAIIDEIARTLRTAQQGRRRPRASPRATGTGEPRSAGPSAFPPVAAD